MKPSSRKQEGAVSSGARLYACSGVAGVWLALVAAMVLMMTLNERALAAPSSELVANSKVGAAAAAANSATQASSSSGQDDKLALASEQRQARSLAPVAKRETITQHQVSSQERKLTVGSGKDLSIGQSIANAKVQMSSEDMEPAAAGHYGGGGKGHGKYYMYAESPKKGAYKAGFKRGNHKHMIMRKEAQHKSHAHGYMKWSDKKGKGSHKWEYKHSKGKHYY